MRIGSYVQALCTAMRLAKAAPRPSERSLPHGAVAQRVIDLTESVAGRGVRGFVAGPGRAMGALSTDGFVGALQKKQNGFSLLPTCSCIVFGRVPRPEYCYIAN